MNSTQDTTNSSDDDAANQEAADKEEEADEEEESRFAMYPELQLEQRQQNSQKLQNLFQNCIFFLSREVIDMSDMHRAHIVCRHRENRWSLLFDVLEAK
jgi:hypothetical protein